MQSFGILSKGRFDKSQWQQERNYIKTLVSRLSLSQNSNYKSSETNIIPGPRGHHGFDGRCGKNGKHGRNGKCGPRGNSDTFHYDIHAKQICERTKDLLGDGYVIVEVDGCMYRAASSEVASLIYNQIYSR